MILVDQRYTAATLLVPCASVDNIACVVTVKTRAPAAACVHYEPMKAKPEVEMTWSYDGNRTPGGSCTAPVSAAASLLLGVEWRKETVGSPCWFMTMWGLWSVVDCDLIYYYAVRQHSTHINAISNKKLSCRREAARCFVSLNISLSPKVTQGHAKWPPWVGHISIPLFYVSLVPFLRYSVSNNGVRSRSVLLKMVSFGSLGLFPFRIP